MSGVPWPIIALGAVLVLMLAAVVAACSRGVWLQQHPGRGRWG